jgi:hypothetical protein
MTERQPTNTTLLTPNLHKVEVIMLSKEYSSNFVIQSNFAFGLEHEERVVRQPIPKLVPIKESHHILYLDFLADMLPPLREIDEIESASLSTYYIPGCEVPMHYSNTMKIVHQLVHLDSGASHV